MRLQLENVSKVATEGEDFRWFVKVKCSNCGEELAKWVYVTEVVGPRKWMEVCYGDNTFRRVFH